jgi:hypothetical protein
VKKSYREGVANHPDPEPCEGGGNGALEALDSAKRRRCNTAQVMDRGICRLGNELRNRVIRGADGVRQSGRQQRVNATARAWRGPAESKTPSMQWNSMRENREAPQSPAGSRRAGRRRR